MKLPFVSRNTHEEVLQELYIKQKILENTYQLLDESTERNLKLNEEKMELDKKYKGLVSYNKQVQANAENASYLLENSKYRESKLLDINKDLKNKIDKFEIDAIAALKVEMKRQRKSRKKKQKQRQIDNFILDKVFEVVFKDGEKLLKDDRNE